MEFIIGKNIEDFDGVRKDKPFNVPYMMGSW